MTRLHYTDYTRDLMAMAIEALAEWARMRGIVSPAEAVDTDNMPTFQREVKTTMTEYLTEDETSSVQRNRLQARHEQEVRFRELGQFDWADRTRDNTDTLLRGGEIRRRRGGARDDE